jgi:hypothetical protein
MKNKVLLSGLSIISAGLLFNGCLMMPYHNDFICKGGSNTHICKRVSNIYEDTEFNNDINETSGCNCNKTKTNDNNDEFNNEFNDITSYNYYNYECKKKNEKLKNKIINIQKNNQELKEIVTAISYEELKKPVKVMIINKKNNQKENNNSVIELNKAIKVCVLNANIRNTPNCKGKVVKVAHKGEKLFAYYLKGAWIKTKKGYIHKSLVCDYCSKVKK